MAAKPNIVLRIVVPAVLLLGGLGLFWAMTQSRPPGTGAAGGSANTPAPAGTAPAPQETPSAANAAASEKPTEPARPADATPTPAGGQTGAVAPAAVTAPAKPPLVLSAKVQGPSGQALAPLGGVTPAKDGGQFKMRVVFSPFGAGIDSIALADHAERVGPGAPPQVVLERVAFEYPVYDATGAVVSSRLRTLVPFSLLGVSIDGVFVNLAALPDGEPWAEVAPGHFRAEIVDDAGAPVARVERRYELGPGSYGLALRQSLENLTGRPVSVVWHQIGPVDAPIDLSYGGDMRRIRYGIIAQPSIDPEQAFVIGGTHGLIEHATALGTLDWDPAQGSFGFRPFSVWPEPSAGAGTPQSSLAWVAMTSRYFAVAAHALPEAQPRRTDTPSKNALDRRLHAGAKVERIGLGPATGDQRAFTPAARQALRMTSDAVTVAPGQTAMMPLGIYAGPISHRHLEADAATRQVGLGGLEIYYYGGPCGWCTFQPIATVLHGYLTIVHDWLLRDWALSIVLLVLTVRTILHPVTRWSQRNMSRFGKQMAALAPKQAKLKEKYGSDPKKLQEELGKLMREENVSYAGALGCLPAFLQTPVWIALYAMIAFNFELRHSGAFFGVFQWASAQFNAFWPFLADLSVEDRFIPLPFSVDLWLFKLSSINLLPFILGGVFYVQQKYLSPPQSAQMTPEQEQQQKIVKVMMVVLFPLMMYHAPAALSLYFIVNSGLGSIEAKWIRKGLDAEEKAKAALGAAGVGTAMFDRKDRAPAAARRTEPGKRPGFFERIRLAVEEAQRLKAEQDRRKDKGRTR